MCPLRFATPRLRAPPSRAEARKCDGLRAGGAGERPDRQHAAKRRGSRHRARGRPTGSGHRIAPIQSESRLHPADADGVAGIGARSGRWGRGHVAGSAEPRRQSGEDPAAARRCLHLDLRLGTRSWGRPSRRPTRIELGDKQVHSCGFGEGYMIRFTDHGQLIQAFVRLGSSWKGRRARRPQSLRIAD